MKAAPTKEATFELELELRTRALDTKGADRREAIIVLADFYEQHGQPSRAALWRAQLEGFQGFQSRDRRFVPHDVPDLLTREHSTKGFDCRRNQMIWLLQQQPGLSVRKVAAAFGLSPTRVEQIIALEDRRINMHARDEQLQPTLKATERLLVAGALPGDRPTRHGHQEPWFDLCEDLPEDWPAEHKRKIRQR